MAVSAIPARAVPAPRIQSADALRGAIMMLMAIDHIRDYVARSAQQFSPTDLTRTTAAIFLTRRITHFCAPVFMLTAGLGAYLWMTRGHHAKGELSRLLISRGIWLIALEVTVLRLIMFSQISFTANPVLLIILWAIGFSMIALAGLIYLPMRVLMGISIAIIALHNLLDDVSAERFGRAAWIWDILYQRGVIAFDGIKFRPAYPVLPWIGVMAGGYCLGMVFDWDADRRRRFLVRLGLALAAAFVVVRAVNVYGDPLRWSHQASPVFTVLSFLNVTKYPPSLDFLLMTLGPAMVVMAWLENFHFHFTNPLIVFWRVPFFYYGAHLLLAHLIASGPVVIGISNSPSGALAQEAQIALVVPTKQDHAISVNTYSTLAAAAGALASSTVSVAMLGGVRWQVNATVVSAPRGQVDHTTRRRLDVFREDRQLSGSNGPIRVS